MSNEVLVVEDDPIADRGEANILPATAPMAVSIIEICTRRPELMTPLREEEYYTD